jgi:hypothetical protein
VTNKYANEARQARAQYRRWRGCTRKRRYATKAEAEATGNDWYECDHCGGFHTTTKFKKLVGICERKGVRT